MLNPCNANQLSHDRRLKLDSEQFPLTRILTSCVMYKYAELAHSHLELQALANRARKYTCLVSLKRTSEADIYA